ncbi:hypothetical protein H072_6628 [Dactylellina haptotyla CBS 200.50]|uniref:DUF7029 domain-containing protein n=1 Tax=Dactylellina haptotyla (strain CBS 200.50) TaxID=1284197 RepID=S8AEH3_DACHA|nr:hypothetical protein H072_6628 [Dactylellina haptotyla CBS 200.50]
MHSKLSFAAAALFGAASVAAAPTSSCNADNLLRLLRGKSASASSFCATYTTAPATAGQAYPTWLSAYTTSTSRVSSACSCLATAPPTTSAPSTLTFGSYEPPKPTETSSVPTQVANPLPTITGAPIPLNTAAFSDSVPPAPTKEVYFGNLGDDNSTALVAHVSYVADDASPLVNLDDLIGGLNGFPVCGSNSISLKFTTTPNRDLAASKWTSKFTLVTSGGNYCGAEGEHNFFKVSSASSSGSDTITLSTTQVDIKDALASFDSSFGTFNISDPAPSSVKRSLEKRDTISAKAIWAQIVNFISNGATKRVTTPQWSYDFTSTNLFQVNVDGFSGSVTCNNCGITGAVQLFGQVSFDVKNLLATGAILGFDLVNPYFNLDMGVGWRLEYSKTIEVPIFTIVPWSVEIPHILTIEPAASLIASINMQIKSAFQIKNLGFEGSWETLSIGYNLLTKLPVVSGNIIPKITYRTPIFNNGVSLYGNQEADVTVWLGPRLGLEIDILSGAAHGEAKIEVQFPAINVGAKLDDLSKCPGASGNDMCVYVHSDALIRGVASAGAGLVGVGDVGVEHELFKYNLGTIVDDHFLIDI